MGGARRRLEQLDGRTPVIVGVGQSSERLDADGYRALSPAALAAAAALAALDDAGPGPALRGSVDLVAGVRQFDISGPDAVAPLGCSDNFPRSVADRVGIDPARAVLDVVGGQTPQALVSEMAADIASGGVRAAMLLGSEAISTCRHFAGRLDAPDFSEKRGGQLEDRGYGLQGLVSRYGKAHGLNGTPGQYAIAEHARRARVNMSRPAYARAMGELFASFSTVASMNSHAAAPTVRSSAELVTVTARNRMIADPYPRFLVARDQVDQGAAVLMTSLAQARELRIDTDRMVFLHGYANLRDKPLLERPDLGSSPPTCAAITEALRAAGLASSDLDVMDLYSCFPIAVFNVCDEPVGRSFHTATTTAVLEPLRQEHT